MAPAATRADSTGGWSGTFFHGGSWEDGETYVHWDDAEHAEESDDERASAWLGDGPDHIETKPLIVAAFGFEIPLDATIDGIEVIIERGMLAPEGLGSAAVRDASVRLLKEWDASGDEKANASLDWTPYDETVTYGGPTDLWDVSWTPEEINANGFGALLMAWRTEAGIENQRMAEVDEIMVNVYYTPVSGNGGGNEEEPVDVCLNQDGIQTDASECPPDGNGEGEEGPADLCSNIDGVQESVPDGMTATDTICTSSEGGSGSVIENTTEESSGGGGGSRRSSRNRDTDTAIVEGEVLGICAPYLTGYIKPGAANDTAEVTKLQEFLRVRAGETGLAVTGVYDEATIAAVRRFQSTYAGDILAPWGASMPTGHVYYTTQKKINEMACEGVVAFPLSGIQWAEIAAYRARIAALYAGEENISTVDVAPGGNAGWLPSLAASALEALKNLFER